MSNPIMTFDPCEALTIREAARLLSVSRPTVEKYVKAGELPSALIGRCRRIRRADLEAFLERRTAYGWRRHEPEPPRPDDAPAAPGHEYDFLGSDNNIPFP